MELLFIIIALCIAFESGSRLGQRKGWVKAHITVAEECRKLGKFYVGKTVFTCTHIEEKPSEEVK